MANFGEIRKAQLAKSTLLTSTSCSWDLFISFKVCLDAKERVVAESNGKLPHLLIPSKTATLVPKFAVEDLRLGRTAALVPELAVKDMPLGRTLWWCWWWHIILQIPSSQCKYVGWGGFLTWIFYSKLQQINIIFKNYDNVQGGRTISSILLTVVGDGWKDQKMYVQYGV